VEGGTDFRKKGVLAGRGKTVMSLTGSKRGIRTGLFWSGGVGVFGVWGGSKGVISLYGGEPLGPKV